MRSLCRRWLPAGFALIVLPLAACQPVPSALTPADEQAIHQAAAAFAQGVLAKDWAAIGAMYQEDAVFMAPNAPAVSGPAAIEAFLAGFPPLNRFELRPMETVGMGDLAVERGRYSLAMMPPGATAEVPDSGKYVVAWRRQADGTWRIMWDIFNSDVPLPAPPPPVPERRR